MPKELRNPNEHEERSEILHSDVHMRDVDGETDEAHDQTG
jgi:hypothetical protein